MTERMALAEAAPEAYRSMLRTGQIIAGGPLDRRLQELVKIRASQINGCAFCVDAHTAQTRAEGEDERRIHHLTVWAESPLYSGAERAALAYTEAATRREDVDDELWKALTEHFTEAERGSLVMLVALINALNLMARPLRKTLPT
ncbi:carboxymuconolactone decarboxylase family protein [Spirillospora sp. NPDC127200]